MTKIDVLYNLAKSGELNLEKSYYHDYYFCGRTLCSFCSNDKQDCDLLFSEGKRRAVSQEVLDEFFNLYPEYKIIS